MQATQYTVRTELVEVPFNPIILSLSKDRLSPNGFFVWREAQ